MFKKLRFKNACLFFLMGCLPLIGAWSQPLDPNVNRGEANAEPTLDPVKSVVPIDAAVPDVFETASFGLG